MNATETKTTTFISKCPNLTLVIEPGYTKYGALGNKIGTEPGKSVKFEDHHFRTDDVDVIEWLRAHDYFNVPSAQGFWELGNAPNEPKPTIPAQQAAIAEAAANRDIAALEAVIEEEEATHKREVVFATARAALAALAGVGEGSGDSSSTSQPSDQS